VVEDVDRPAFQKAEVNSQAICPTYPRAEAHEVAQASGRHTVEVAVAVCHQFVGLLTLGIQ